MEIRTKLCNPANYGVRRTNPPAYIVIHYTSNWGDSAKNNADYFAREAVRASAHYFVDESEVWQSVPDDRIAWHVGAKQYFHPACRNANAIGVEICMNDRNGRVRQGSIDRAAQLVRLLMKEYGIPADHVVRHYDVTHKNCPAPMVEKPALWAAFRAALEVKNVSNDNTPAAWAKDAWERATNAKIVDGTRPTEPVTRQELAVILDRLGLIGGSEGA